MGQYYVIANLDKREFVNPYAFGSGVKLMEFAGDGQSVMMGVAVLLASSNGQGGGDLHLPAESTYEGIPGRWAGNRIVVAGDYDDNPESPGYKVYERCGDVSPLEELAGTVDDNLMSFRDISYEVLGCLLEDHHFREGYLSVASSNSTWAAYIKKKRREAWVLARPTEQVPESLV
jgi:hypothetical protein